MNDESKNDNKTFEWYSLVVDLGKNEIDHGRTRFYNTAKLHLAVLAGGLALAAYGVTNDKLVISFAAELVFIFGIFNAIAWWKQIISSSWYEAYWYGCAIGIEESSDFRSIVGAANVEVFSSDLMKERLRPDKKAKGASPSMYRLFAISSGTLNVLLVIGNFIEMKTLEKLYQILILMA